MLEKRPPNDKARFFDYSVSKTGLVVTVCEIDLAWLCHLIDK